MNTGTKIGLTIAALAVAGGGVAWAAAASDDDDDDEPTPLPPAEEPTRREVRKERRKTKRTDRKTRRGERRDERRDKRRERRDKRRDEPTAPKQEPRTPSPAHVPSTDEPPTGGRARMGQSGVLEVRNAGDAVYFKPKESANAPAPYNRQRQGQPLKYWLTDHAYFATYPNAPKQLDPKNPKHANYIKAWKRILGYVERAMAVGDPGKSPKLGVPSEDYGRFVLRMAATGPKHLQHAQNLRAYYSGALDWTYDNKAWAIPQLHKELPNKETAGASGVHGLVFWRMANKLPLPAPDDWNVDAPRGVVAVNKIY